MTKEEMYATIETYYRANKDTLVQRIRHSVGGIHNAEDVVQSAFMRALEYWNSKNEDDEFNHWFSVILKNCIYDLTKEEVHHGMAEAEEVSIEPHLQIEDKMVLEKIASIIRDMKKGLVKYILDLHFIKGLAVRDIRKIVAVPQSTIYNHIFTFREALKRMNLA